MKGECGREALLRFPGEGAGRQDEQVQDRLVCMIPGLWGGGAAGVTRTGGQWP